MPCSGCGINLIAKVTNHMSLIGVLYSDSDQALFLIREILIYLQSI